MKVDENVEVIELSDDDDDRDRDDKDFEDQCIPLTFTTSDDLMRKLRARQIIEVPQKRKLLLRESDDVTIFDSKPIHGSVFKFPKTREAEDQPMFCDAKPPIPMEVFKIPMAPSG